MKAQVKATQVKTVFEIMQDLCDRYEAMIASPNTSTNPSKQESDETIRLSA